MNLKIIILTNASSLLALTSCGNDSPAGDDISGNNTPNEAITYNCNSITNDYIIYQGDQKPDWNNYFRVDYEVDGSTKYVDDVSDYITENISMNNIGSYDVSCIDIDKEILVENKNVKDFEFTIINSQASVRITNYTGNNSDVIIPDYIAGMPVETIGEKAFYGNSLTSVTLPSSLKSIESYAFYGNNLISASIPNNVISIEDYAFYGNNIANLYIGNSVTTIGRSSFSNNSLTEVTIPDSIQYIENYAFNSNKLTSVTFGLNSQLIRIGDRAFAGNELTSFTIPKTCISVGSYAISTFGSGFKTLYIYYDDNYAANRFSENDIKSMLGIPYSFSLTAEVIDHYVS